MKTEIIQKNKNPFLNREELLMEIHNEVSPSFEEIKKTLGKEEGLVVVRKVHSNFGKKKFLAEIMIYDSKEDLERVETVPQKVRKKMEEERKAAEDAARKEKAAAKKAAEVNKESAQAS